MLFTLFTKRQYDTSFVGTVFGLYDLFSRHLSLSVLKYRVKD